MRSCVFFLLFTLIFQDVVFANGSSSEVLSQHVVLPKRTRNIPFSASRRNLRTPPTLSLEAPVQRRPLPPLVNRPLRDHTRNIPFSASRNNLHIPSALSSELLIQRRPLPPLANRTPPLSPFASFANRGLPVPIAQGTLAPQNIEAGGTAESNEFLEIARQRLARFSEIARGLLHGSVQVLSASEEQEYTELLNYFKTNQKLDQNIFIEFCLILCELRCFGFIEESVLTREASIDYLLEALETLDINESSARALYILLFTLSTLSNDEISDFEEVIDELFRMLPHYLGVDQDAKNLICLGYSFLKLEHNKSLPSIEKIVDIILVRIEKKQGSLEPLHRALLHVYNAKLTRYELDSETTPYIYGALAPKGNKFYDNKFIIEHVRYVFLVLVLGKNSGLDLPEDEFMQLISDIFKGYNLENYDDLKRCLAMIMDFINKEQHAISLHVENAQFLVHFLKKKIRSFPQEQKILLLKDLGCISIRLLATLVPEEYEAADFLKLNESVQILYDFGLFQNVILSFFSEENSGDQFVIDPDEYAMIVGLKNNIDENISYFFKNDKERRKNDKEERKILRTKLRRNYILSTILFVALNYDSRFDPEEEPKEEAKEESKEAPKEGSE